MTIKFPRLFPYQMQFHESAMKNRFNAIAGGRRVGKSHYALFWFFIGGMLGNTGVSVWVSPTMKQARAVGMLGFVSLTSNIPDELKEIRHGAFTVRISGHDFLFTSSDNADSIRGLKIKRVVLDETAFQKQYAWTNVIRPALADLQGSALFVSTYDGFNWYHEIMNDESWNSATWPTRLNPVITDDEIDLLKSTMDEQAYKQEILAIPTTAKGLVFERVFGNDSIIADISPRKNDSYAISIDFGYNDPTAISFYSYHQETSMKFNVIKFDEMEERGKLLEEIMPHVVRRLQNWGIDPINLPCAVDIAGRQHTGVSEWSYIDRLSEMNIFKLFYKKVQKESAINFLRAQFLNANGDRNFKICRRCKKTIASYTAYEIRINERPYDDSKHDHFPDGDTYFFENLIRPKIISSEKYNTPSPRHGKPKMEKCPMCGKKFITFTSAVICTSCRTAKILEV